MQLSDDQWSTLTGGYGTPYDPRAAVQCIAIGNDAATAWAELWEELHHQGDVGEASYAAIPLIAQLVANRQTDDWNPFALAATIEEARRNDKNPALPDWLAAEYAKAWMQLFSVGLGLLPEVTDEDLICSIMAVLAAHKGLPMLARMAILSEAERSDMLDEVGWA